MNARRLARRGEGRADALVACSASLLLLVLVGNFLYFNSFRRGHGHGHKPRCSQQMRDLGMAINQYEIDKRMYPGYRNVLLMSNDASYVDPDTKEGGVSWVVPVLPYLDQQAIYDALRTPDSGSTGVAAGAPVVTTGHARITIYNLICPADPPPLAGGTPLAYVANTGCIDAPGAPKSDTSPGIPRDWPANGVFFDRFTGHPMASQTAGGVGALKEGTLPIVKQTNAWIGKHDGLTQTIMLTENVDHGQYTDVFEPAVGVIWDIDAKVVAASTPIPSLHLSATPTLASYRINHSKGAGAATTTGAPATASSRYDYARPSSMHVGGVNVIYCDGHVGFLNEQMEYFVYCLLMTPDGANAKKPGDTKPLDHRNFATPVDDAWIYGN